MICNNYSIFTGFLVIFIKKTKTEPQIRTRLFCCCLSKHRACNLSEIRTKRERRCRRVDDPGEDSESNQDCAPAAMYVYESKAYPDH